MKCFVFEDPFNGYGGQNWEFVFAKTEDEAWDFLREWLETAEGRSKYTGWIDGRKWERSSMWSDMPKYVTEQNGYVVIPRQRWETVKAVDVPLSGRLMSFDFYW